MPPRLLLALLWFSCAFTALAQINQPAPRSTRQTVYVLRLKPGQDLRAELARFAQAQRLRAAYVITCVGSLNHASLRLANQPDYQRFAGKLEIVSLVGTLAADGMHLHLSASDITGKTIGGHLGEGCEIYTTAEIVIGEAIGLHFTREKDATYGYDELAVKPRRSQPAHRRRN